MQSRRIFFAATSAALLACPALAQTDQVATAHAAAANQLGVLEYCQSQGAVDANAVEAERSSIARLPASTADTSAAEDVGKRGTISLNGSTMTLSSIASGRNTTVAAVCKQMGDAAVQTAAAFATQGARPGMPTTPGMPAMPAMPQGMTMPPMPPMPPGYPTMPGMPKQ